MTQYRFHPEAREELAAATRSYQEGSPQVASAFVAEVRSALDRVVAFPESGIPSSDDIRKVFLTRFPFTVVYRGKAGQLEIIAVMHQRRRPGYWRHRISISTP